MNPLGEWNLSCLTNPRVQIISKVNEKSRTISFCNIHNKLQILSNFRFGSVARVFTPPK